MVGRRNWRSQSHNLQKTMPACCPEFECNMTCVRECPSERDKDAKNPSTQWGIARSETAPSPRQQASSLLLPSHHENHLEVA
mmetsp:Transcript_17200/g.30158  ORF Transcript_17200/g.30158 Transcript_17200/m.30158 type:complete len:82 (+) Transcript_17200:219-464(+)